MSNNREMVMESTVESVLFRHKNVFKEYLIAWSEAFSMLSYVEKH